MGGEDYVDGIEAGAWIDIAVANYGSKGRPMAGMTKANCSGQSTEMARYGADLTMFAPREIIDDIIEKTSGGK